MFEEHILYASIMCGIGNTTIRLSSESFWHSGIERSKTGNSEAMWRNVVESIWQVLSSRGSLKVILEPRL